MKKTLFIIPIIFSALGCFGVDLPKHVMIENSFTDQEKEKILEAIGEWNRISQEKLGHPALIFDGFITAEFNQDTMAHEPGIIFKSETEDYYYKLVKSNNSDSHTAGYATRGFVRLYPAYTVYENQNVFKLTVIHELGHFIGLEHNPNSNTVMFWILNEENKKLTNLTEEDARSFCIVYDCN